ncbi:MAG: hypothetical protein HC896_09260 [Bacteroidales bacterium]|nr:hypothetical protein [Bacteroidales bacterium]
MKLIFASAFLLAALTANSQEMVLELSANPALLNNKEKSAHIGMQKSLPVAPVNDSILFFR